MRYCPVLEEQSFRNRPADFLFMLLFGASAMLVRGHGRGRGTGADRACCAPT